MQDSRHQADSHSNHFLNFRARVRNVLRSRAFSCLRALDRVGLERLPLVHSERLQPRSL